MTYGTARAPFLTIRCLKQLNLDHEFPHPQASRVIRKEFYVDDLTSGAETVNETICLGQEMSSILK